MEVPRIAAQSAKTSSTTGRSVDAAPKPAVRSGLDCPRRGPAILWLVIVLTAIAAILTYHAVVNKFDKQLHRTVTERLSEFFPHASVIVGRVAFNERGNVVINDLRMAVSCDTRGKKRRVISCERVVVTGNLDIAHWVQQTIRIDQLDLHGVQLDAWPQAAGHWSIEELRPAPSQNACTPTVVIHDALLKLHRDSSDKAPVIVFHDIRGRVAPLSPSEVAACSPSALSMNLSASSSGLMRQLTLQGWLDAPRQNWAVHGTVDKFEFTHELLESLPPQASRYLHQVKGLECEASFAYKVFSRPQQVPGFTIESGTLTDGRLQDSRLPYPLDQLHGKFYCDNTKLQIRELCATSGGTSLVLDTDIEGFTLDVPMTIAARATGLELDRRLHDSLPVVWQTYWDRLKLEGIVDADVSLSFDGQRWSYTANFDCRSISMTPWLFPYPLENVTGRVTFKDGEVSSELLSGTAGGQPVQGAVALHKSADQWFGEIACRTLGAVSVDEKLLTALTPVGQNRSPAESFVRTLHPAGVVQLTSATFKRSEGDIWRRQIDASVYNGKIRYDGFSYPIYEIRGRLQGEDDNWRLEQFEGRNSSGRILCNGGWTAVKQGPVPMRLQFRALAVQLDEELKQALPNDAQYVWNQLQPEGSIDAIDVHLARPATDKPVELVVSLREDNKQNEASGRSLRMYPKEFPYWLTDVACDITYSAGQIRIASASASNGGNHISLEGNCTRDDANKRWIASFHWLPSTHFLVNNQLLQALPESIRQSLLRLDFRGYVSVLGKSEAVITPASEQGIASTWNCQLDIEDAQLGDGTYVDAMRGTVWMQGKKEGDAISASGNIAMDALTVKGVPVTGLTGPFTLLGSQLFFGRSISDALPQASGIPPQISPLMPSLANSSSPGMADWILESST